MKWISVKDRLPTDADKSAQTGEKYECYLCRLQLGKYAYYKVLGYADCLLQVSVDFDEIEHGGFFDYDSEVGFYEANYVTHWMPIEPPKEVNV